MKRIITVLILYFCILSAVSGQESPKNMVAGGINLSAGPWLSYIPLPGINFEYERMLGNMFSIGGEIGSNMFYPFVEIFGSWYPWSKMFFTRLGLGWWSLFGPSLMTEIGWKINIGKKNTWALIPSLKGRMSMFIMEKGVSIGGICELGLKIGYKF